MDARLRSIWLVPMVSESLSLKVVMIMMILILTSVSASRSLLLLCTPHSTGTVASFRVDVAVMMTDKLHVGYNVWDLRADGEATWLARS